MNAATDEQIQLNPDLYTRLYCAALTGLLAHAASNGSEYVNSQVAVEEAAKYADKALAIVIRRTKRLFP